MQILKILPKLAPSVLIGMTMLNPTATKLNATNDSFEKKEFITILNEEKENIGEKDIPWGDIIPVGCLVALCCTILLGEHIDKKIDAKETKKSNK